MELPAETLNLVELLQHPLSLLGVVVFLAFKHFNKQQSKTSDISAQLLNKLIEKDSKYDKSSLLDWNKRLESEVDEVKDKLGSVETRIARIEANLEIIKKKVLNGQHKSNN